MKKTTVPKNILKKIQRAEKEFEEGKTKIVDSLAELSFQTSFPRKRES